MASEQAQPRVTTERDSGGLAGRFFARFSPTFWTLLALGASVTHHIDHVLRYDHSGWPFTPDVNAFTFSLLVYPVVASILWARARPGYQAGASGLGLALVLGAHILLETPRAQFHTWAAGVSDSPGTLGAPNLLEVASPALGVAAVAVANVLHLAVALAMWGYGRRAWLQKAPTERATTAAGTQQTATEHTRGAHRG
jgi:hypothetical protein